MAIFILVSLDGGNDTCIVPGFPGPSKNPAVMAYVSGKAINLENHRLTKFLADIVPLLYKPSQILALIATCLVKNWIDFYDICRLSMKSN